ncbi:MAG: DNA mismatch repair endonuclease MutL [Thermodesulfobacteriota bacterium]
MAKIRILPDILVSKIAAGEVVERPASVVKELVENSLDAGAKFIKIELRAGGKRYISVTDDGHGMSGDDALMSLERHATSKIKSIDDLFSLVTLGFRGEALPSIASVSRFKLLTRQRDDNSGTSIIIDGGKIRRVDDAGCPFGTAIEVKNLFFNTPPRLRFLKKNETELIRTIEIIQREAISNPDVGFETINDDRVVFKFEPKQKIFERLKDIVNSKEIFDVDFKSEGIKVHGFLSSPLSNRTNTQKLYTYVNSRPVKDRFITRIIMDSYGKMLPSGKFPQGALFIEIDSGDVDVNVHPTKHEIRFRNQSHVGSIIKQAIGNMLSTAPWMLGYGDTLHKRDSSFYEQKQGYINPRGFSDNAPPKSYVNKEPFNPAVNFEENFEEAKRHFIPDTISVSDENPQQLFENSGYFSSLKILGQVGALYLVCENENGLILIDQHAAHERVNYEKFKKVYLESGKVQKQDLLIPEIVEVSPREIKLFEKFMAELDELGYGCELFGDSAIRIISIPAILESQRPSEVIVDLLAELDEFNESRSLADKFDLIFATMACHGSIRANQNLSKEMIFALLQSLDAAEFPHSCPHGRPVARVVTFPELEKMFWRT